MAAMKGHGEPAIEVPVLLIRDSSDGEALPEQRVVELDCGHKSETSLLGTRAMAATVDLYIGEQRLFDPCSQPALSTAWGQGQANCIQTYHKNIWEHS